MPIARRKSPILYIPLDRAIEKHYIPRNRLEQAIETGEIESARLDDGTTLLVAESLRAWLAGRRVDRAQFAHLEGQEISITEAAKKYGFSPSSIKRWMRKGYIRDLGLAPGYKRRRLVNEADVAYTRALIDLKKPAPGQPVYSD
jgi:AraC-like DNA-binding protein